MVRTGDEMVAYALEIDPGLLPFVPELLSDFEVLGADTALIVGALASLGITQDSIVVDLGCGKGGVAIAIAQSLGCRVVGVELFAPFVAHARSAAIDAGVDELCQFVDGEIGALAAMLELADAVVFAALGDVLGPLDVTVATIRQYARPGGYVVVNDSFLLDGVTTTFPGFENYGDLVQTRHHLTACGDDLVLELFESPDDAEGGVEEWSLVARRATELAGRYPHVASAFEEFARTQAAEYDYLDESTRGAVWAVQRAY